jgi:hypothetical protein
MKRRKVVSDNLVERLSNWEKVYPEDMDKPQGSLHLEAADRIEELTEVLEAVDAWVEDLGYYADDGAELVPVFKKVKAVLGKGYK